MNSEKNMVNKKDFEKYITIFLQENSKINLISKNDEKFLWEKHIFDSLSIEKFFDKYMPAPQKIKLLDIGTGGGFPAIPVAIKYPEVEVTALDSIAKKIRAVDNIAKLLELKNLHPVCIRVENFDEKFDVITSRAVSSLKNICEYALPKLKKNGYFIAYKSQKAEEEILEAQSVLKKYKAKVTDIIEYELPLDEKIRRNLIIITL